MLFLENDLFFLGLLKADLVVFDQFILEDSGLVFDWQSHMTAEKSKKVLFEEWGDCTWVSVSAIFALWFEVETVIVIKGLIILLYLVFTINMHWSLLVSRGWLFKHCFKA